MPLPPTDPRPRTALDDHTWRDVAASLALVPALAALVWAASAPLAAGAAALVLAATVAATRRARRLARCVERCRALAYDLPGGVRVTFAWGESPCRATA